MKSGMTTTRRGRTGLVLLSGMGLIVLLAVVAAPIAFLAFAGGGETIEVADSSLRYRLLIAGSPVDGMPQIDPDGAEEYYYRAQDGLSPETKTLVYRSGAPAAAVLEFYRAACDTGAFGTNGSVIDGDGTRVVCAADAAIGAVRISPDGDGTEIIIEFIEITEP